MPNWLLFLVPSLIWGTTWLTIKFQLGVVAPEVSVAYVLLMKSLVLFGWCLIRRVPLRFDARTHVSFALLGTLQYALNYVFVYRSEGYLTSGLVAVVFVVVVAWNLIGARFFFGEPLHASIVGGAAIGMAGVALVFWPELSHVRGAPGELHGVLLGVGGTIAASAGNLWSQRVYARGVAVGPSTAWAMLYGATGVAIYCVMRRLPFAFDASFRYVASLAYLTLFGSVFAFLGYLTLLKRIGAGRSGYVAVAIPVLAMASSTVFEGYRLSGLALLGMALVLAGNVLVLRGKQRVVRR